MSDPLLSRLRFSTEERQRIVALVRHHLVCYEPSWTDAAVRRWIRRVGPDLIEDLMALNHADILARGRDPEADLARSAELAERVEQALAAGAALTVRDLAIGGRELIGELGLEPGPLLGRILQSLLEEVTDDPARNEREALLQRARELARADEPIG
jgi:tRNA nucleotidyltransferase (CCA-adding enzyme)